MPANTYLRLVSGEPFLFPLTPRALWKLLGSDRERYLNGQVTSDVVRLPEQEATYAAVCTAKGKMEGDLFIARWGEAFYLDAEAGLQDHLSARLEKYLIADDAEFTSLTDMWKVTHVFGGTAPQVAEPGFVIKNFRYLMAGWDVWQPREMAELEGEVISAADVETLRLELALPRWGAELNETTLPPEAGRESRWISYQKGCYVGQETIARIKSIGHVNRVLVQLEAEDETIPEVGQSLILEGKTVGQITSCGYSPRLQKGIALAYVQRAHAVVGTRISVHEKDLTVREPLPIWNSAPI